MRCPRPGIAPQTRSVGLIAGSSSLASLPPPPCTTALLPRPVSVPLLPAPLPSTAARRSVAAAASSQPKDFDEFLMVVADKFEKVDNKPVVVG